MKPRRRYAYASWNSELEYRDACYNIALVLAAVLSIVRKTSHRSSMTTCIRCLSWQTIWTQMNRILVGHRQDNDVNRSFNIETEINNYRNQLRRRISTMNDHKFTYAVGTMVHGHHSGVREIRRLCSQCCWGSYGCSTARRIKFWVWLNKIKRQGHQCVSLPLLYHDFHLLNAYSITTWRVLTFGCTFINHIEQFI